MKSETQMNEVIKRICKSLASPDIKLRHRGFKRLKEVIKFSNSGSHNLELEHCLLIWKGLHYWLWSQDKLLRQEALVDQICTLLTSIKTQRSKLDFIAAFFETEVREWKTLDKWRTDKFLKLFRRFFKQSLEELQSDEWEWVDSFVEILQRFTICTERSDSAFGLRLHCISIYLEELSQFELSSDLWLKFLQPYFCLVPQMPRDHPLLKRVEDMFFLILPPTEEEDEDPLSVDFKAMGDFLYHLAGAGGKNLRKLYEWSTICYGIAGAGPPPDLPAPIATLPADPVKKKKGRGSKRPDGAANGDAGRSPPAKRSR